MNVICVVGRLVHDPELKNSIGGNSVTNFTVAVERNRAGQDGQKAVDYIDIVCWRKTAEFVCNYFQKGSWIAVNGSLQTRTYINKEGNNRKVYEIVADAVNFAGSKERASTEAFDNQQFTELDGADDETLPF